MDEKSLALIEKLATAVGQSGNEIIGYYAKWYTFAGIGWVVFGCLLMFLGRKIKADHPFFEDFCSPDALAALIRWAVIVLGLLFVFCNLADIFAPEGMAVHQIIKDLTGK